MRLSLPELLNRLSPFTPNAAIGIAVYIMIVLAVVVLFTQRKPDIIIQILLTSVILISLVDKVASQAAPLLGAPGQPAVIPLLSQRNLATLLLRMPLLIFPFLAAGMMRKENVKGAMPAIVLGFIGGAYLFLRWFFEQRTGSVL